MSTPAPHQHLLLRTASGIFDDLELYSDQLVIRHRDIISRLREQAVILELSDIVSVKNYPKRSDHSQWIQMKITCHDHKTVEVSYSPEERPQMRELNTLLNELLRYSDSQKPHD
ncbi:MAG: hypothetical protein GC179_22380 [Anaerolineaceae bacterium]|nr:hypothetical protein [Anaerolineaceae bacterium]